jgi:glutamate-1-semialdehyde 2,1-aminomutase
VDKEINSGLTLWNKAIEIIPGGNGLLSKRPQRYAPDIWPTYFSSSSGVQVVDLDGNKYIDMAQMGIGSAILGYAHPELTEAICTAAKLGVNCTLNSPEEVYLAELLLYLNPFAERVKFARGGGEAMSMAIRIGRAASGKTKVLFSGYHGWTDWYIASNIASEDNLSQHLLPGLNPLGIPKELVSTAIPFLYNDINDFFRVIEEHPDAGVICIEGARYDFPTKEFLDAITLVAREKNIVLISDEITSGWRLTDGGVYKLNNFSPDIVVYGKAMGGGYAISAVLGRSSVMDYAEKTFISSTMWTEKIGFVAAIETINILRRDQSWLHLNEIGKLIGEGWVALAEFYGLNISITDFKPLITFKFNHESDNNKLATLFIQEMLKRGYLAATSVYVSVAHTRLIVDEYMVAVDQVFSLLARAIASENIDSFLITSCKSDSFSRVTKL